MPSHPEGMQQHLIRILNRIDDDSTDKYSHEMILKVYDEGLH